MDGGSCRDGSSCRDVTAVGRGVFAADVAKASCKKLEEQFPSFILFKTALSCFIEASTAHNEFTLTAFCQ